MRSLHRRDVTTSPICSASCGGALLVVASLLMCIFVLWARVSSLQNIVIGLEKSLAKHVNTPFMPVEQDKVDKMLPTAVAVPPVQKLQSMQEIGASTGTDKIGVHGYHRFYPYFLENLREKEGLKMLEIGFLRGESYEMWVRYFPKGKVYFMEKLGGKTFPEARFTGDQGSIPDLHHLLVTKDLVSDLDFIIDDGSHHPEHQMKSFQYLFMEGLKPGGIYIIEDIETSYWRSGDTYKMPTLYGKDSPNSTINRMKALIDVVNRRYQPPGEPFHSSFGDALDKCVQSVFFGPNAVVIMKMQEGELKKYDSSTYLWKDKLRKEPAV